MMILNRWIHTSCCLRSWAISNSLVKASVFCLCSSNVTCLSLFCWMATDKALTISWGMLLPANDKCHRINIMLTMNYYKIIWITKFCQKGNKVILFCEKKKQCKNSEFSLLIMSSIPSERIAAKRYSTVKMLLTDTHLIWTPHYYRQFAVSLCKARTFIQNSTWLILTPVMQWTNEQILIESQLC